MMTMMMGHASCSTSGTCACVGELGGTAVHGAEQVLSIDREICCVFRQLFIRGRNERTDYGR